MVMWLGLAHLGMVAFAAACGSDGSCVSNSLDDQDDEVAMLQGESNMEKKGGAMQVEQPRLGDGRNGQAAVFGAVGALQEGLCHFLGVDRQSLGKVAEQFSTSTEFCYERSQFPPNCWAQKPGPATATCTVDSGRITCKCPPTGQVGCHIDNLPAATGRCASKMVYAANGTVHHSGGETDVTGKAQEKYCKNMVKNDQWQTKHLLAASSDGPASTDDGWWGCKWKSDYTWNDGKCRRKARYIGESCWDGWWGNGHCAGSDTSYDEYSTSCYEAKCMPFAWVQDRKECKCAWFGWNFLVACSAAKDQCGGHACVLSGKDGKKYCDYATAQNWGSII
mmetsp:Transcript_99716/g.197754  ORF Transcript_99716/g.197754 Transcript_99716/m.197754 type:complete len:335 (-) Transcript_99716:18-1022(-)